MNEIINILHDRNYSCVIKNADDTRTFSNRGVIDLYGLLTNEPEFLKRSLIADKVVGKAAAALVILGEIDELYTDLISTPALKILKENNIKVSFQTEVPIILNRNQSDWCPLEKLCFSEDSVDAMLNKIETIISKQNHIKS